MGTAQPANDAKQADRFLSLIRRILNSASSNTQRTAFLREVSKILLEFSGCDLLELRHRDEHLVYLWRCPATPESACSLKLLSYTDNPLEVLLRGMCEGLAAISRRLLNHSYPDDPTGFTSHGGFWTNDLATMSVQPGLQNQTEEIGCGSLLLLPIRISSDDVGLLLLQSERTGHFDPVSLAYYESVADTLGLALENRRRQEALRERVKELTCLYSLARVAETPDLSWEAKLERIVRLLPPAWQYPEQCVAQIEIDGWSCSSDNREIDRHVLHSDIVVGGLKRGRVEVAYGDVDTPLDGNPFLPEERHLIAEIARNVAGIIERDEAEAIHRREQIWHADRLATLGKLASGIAHELNEPLNGILGFAQLARKELHNPLQLEADLDRIVQVSLRAREVVRKLLTFAREMPARTSTVQVNSLVREALALVQTRCAVEGIEIVLRLSDRLPEVEADASQLNQVLVNLLVNAMQAMPRGGTLTVETAREPNCLLLIVEDTGIGMSLETRRQIFQPFFTTKDARQGTGLGLAVVHGIVTAHDGTIQVRSSPGAGSRFEVRLPLNDPTKRREGKSGGSDGDS